MATCVVSGTFVDASETGISAATVSFRIVSAYANSSTTNFFVPKVLSTTTGSLGTWSMALSQGISGILSIDYPSGTASPSVRLNYSIVVPATSTANFNTLVTEI